MRRGFAALSLGIGTAVGAIACGGGTSAAVDADAGRDASAERDAPPFDATPGDAAAPFACTRCSGPSDPGPCAIACGLNVPRDLESDGAHLYWSESGLAPSYRSGRVVVAQPSGSPEQIFFFDGKAPFGIAVVDATRVGVAAFAEGAIYLVDPRGGVQNVLASGQGAPGPLAFASNGAGNDRLVWADESAAAHTASSCALGGVTCSTAAPFFDQPGEAVIDLATSGGHVVFVTRGTSGGSLYSAEVGSLAPSPRQAGSDLGAVAAGGAWDAWADGRSVSQLDVAAATAGALVGSIDAGTIAAVASVAAGDVVVSDPGDATGETGRVLRLVRSGATSTVTVLADHQPNPGALLVDGDTLYWVDRGPTSGVVDATSKAGAILRMRLP